MLNVPSVAMIDGSLRTRMITALKIPVPSPTATSTRPPGNQRPPGLVVRHRVGRDDDAERHERRHRDVEAADEERARLSERDESERHRQEEQVVEVEAREERVLTDGRVGADGEDQDRHEDERQRAAEPARSSCRLLWARRSACASGARPASRRSLRRSDVPRARRRGSRRRSARATSRPPDRRGRRARAGRST